jgi:hypothetical protein
MSDTTTTDTSAIDDKKAETLNIDKDYVSKTKSWISSVIIIVIFLILYFSAGGLVLFGCKLAQSNIIPTEGAFEKPLYVKPVDINIFPTTIGNEKMSKKIQFPYDSYNSSNELFDMISEQQDSSSSFLLQYFLSITASISQFYYIFLNKFLNLLHGLPEILIILFGPIIFVCAMSIGFLCNNIYLIYLWFSNMGWFFKSYTHSTPKWENTKITTPINYLIAIWLVIIFGLGFLFTMPVFFFLSFLLMCILIISLLTYKSEMNHKIYTLLNLISDMFKYYKLPLICVIILFIISLDFSKLGTTSGIISIIILGLIYFNVINIPLFVPVNKENMTPLVSYDQAKKTLGSAKKTKNTSVYVGGAIKNWFNSGNIGKELKGLKK